MFWAMVIFEMELKGQDDLLRYIFFEIKMTLTNVSNGSEQSDHS